MEVDHLLFFRYVSTSRKFPAVLIPNAGSAEACLFQAEQLRGEGLPDNARRKTRPDSPLEMDERKPLDKVRWGSPRVVLDRCMGYQ